MGHVINMTDYICTEHFLNVHPDYIFVFGDNQLRIGYGGAAALRDNPQTYGFITKRKPNNTDDAYFKPSDYTKIFEIEMLALQNLVKHNPDKQFLISKIGSGLANRFNIWEKVIEGPLTKFIADNDNVIRFYAV
ncbi:MAG TPA: hypothetical protein PKN48_00535 [Bacteroidales bacterium]|nr:hypothetical protein [Bacteroidales bacterium]